MEFTLHTDVHTLIQCHLNAFRYLGGYTKEILYDNMKQIVLKRTPDLSDSIGTPNSRISSTITVYPQTRHPYRPQTKGKIDNSEGFVKRDFLLGSEFCSFSDLNFHAQSWLALINSTIHGTTNKIPLERLKEEGLMQLCLTITSGKRTGRYHEIHMPLIWVIAILFLFDCRKELLVADLG